MIYTLTHEAKARRIDSCLFTKLNSCYTLIFVNGDTVQRYAIEIGPYTPVPGDYYVTVGGKSEVVPKAAWELIARPVICMDAVPGDDKHPPAIYLFHSAKVNRTWYTCAECARHLEMHGGLYTREPLLD